MHQGVRGCSGAEGCEVEDMIDTIHTLLEPENERLLECRKALAEAYNLQKKRKAVC